MNTILIDADKCKKEGLCVEECPFDLFIKTESGLPELASGYGEVCLNCGHCIAICPGNAITLNGLTSEDCDKVDRKTAPDKKQVLQLLRSRRSIRNFKNEPVDKQVIADLIDLSRWAPTAKNIQPVSWLAVTDKDLIHSYSSHVIDWFKELNLFPALVNEFEKGNDMINRDAPCLLIAHAASDGLKPVVDCSIAATTVEIAAPTFGLGACWAGFFMAAAVNHTPLIDALALPDNHQAYAALMLGLPTHRYSRIPPRNPASVEWR